MIDNGTSVTEMAPSISEMKEDEKTSIESEPNPSKSQQEETKTKSDDKKKQKVFDKTAPSIVSEDETNTEFSKKKKKKKKDNTSTLEQKTKDSSTSSLAKVNIEKEEGKENGTSIIERETMEKKDKKEDKDEVEVKKVRNDPSSGPVVSVSKKTRPQYKYNPEKITLRFLFANKDGLTVTIECNPGDTVGEVKAQLLSVWPEDLDNCSDGDQLRLICMGKGVLMPDTRTIEDCEVPVFKTHPTPVNVAVRPQASAMETPKNCKDVGARGGISSGGVSSSRTTEGTGQGCGCVIS